jgi:hypothetical protein
MQRPIGNRGRSILGPGAQASHFFKSQLLDRYRPPTYWPGPPPPRRFFGLDPALIGNKTQEAIRAVH